MRSVPSERVARPGFNNDHGGGARARLALAGVVEGNSNNPILRESYLRSSRFVRQVRTPSPSIAARIHTERDRGARYVQLRASWPGCSNS